MTRHDGYILIPGWLVKAVGSGTGALIVAAAGWCWSVNGDLREIKANMHAATELRAEEIQSLRRDVTRIDNTCCQ